MDLLAEAEARVRFLRALQRAAKNAGFPSLQAALDSATGISTLLAPRSLQRVKKRRRSLAPVSRAEFTVKTGMKGRHIAQKFGRSLVWVNKTKRNYGLRKPRKMAHTGTWDE